MLVSRLIDLGVVVLLCVRVCAGKRGDGRLGGWERTEETNAHGLGDLDEFAAIGWKWVSD